MGWEEGFAVEVAPEVAELVTQADIEVLGRRAVTGYVCPVCRNGGRVPDDPAALVAFQDGAVMAARVVHAACAASGVVDLPGLAAQLLAEHTVLQVTAVASVLPHADGPRPVLLLEPLDAVSTRSAGGDRVDAMLAQLLRGGLQLVACLGSSPGAVHGWRVRLPGADLLRVVAPDGLILFDGPLTVPDPWRALVGGFGGCVLLCATGLHLDEGDPEAALTALRAAARAGRLVGGLVVVEGLRDRPSVVR